MLRFLEIANLIVAAQSFFLFVHFLLKKKGIRFLNQLMALLGFCFAGIIFNTYLSLIQNTVAQNFIQDVTNNLLWFLGPVFYGYVSYQTQEMNWKRLRWHIFPFVFLMFLDVAFDWEWYQSIIRVLAFVQMFSYLGFSLSICFRNYSSNKSFYSWILPVIFTFAFLMLLNLILKVLASNGIEIISSILLQSLTGLLAFPIFFLSYKEMNAEHAFGIKPKKYKSTPLSKQKASEYLTKIQHALIEEKRFLQPQLTLQILAQEIDIPSKYISQIINQEKGLSFSNFLTELRIEEAKKQLINPENNHLTIAGIAEEVGFASTSRFNHVFKKVTGETPSAYRKKNL